jgi:hypothetical protein
MKGYRLPLKDVSIEIVQENISVGCKRCKEVWHEERSMWKLGARINGPLYDYDYCDKCITDADKEPL